MGRHRLRHPPGARERPQSSDAEQVVPWSPRFHAAVSVWWLYWTSQTASGRTAGTIQTVDVDFGIGR